MYIYWKIDDMKTRANILYGFDQILRSDDENQRSLYISSLGNIPRFKRYSQGAIFTFLRLRLMWYLCGK